MFVENRQALTHWNEFVEILGIVAGEDNDFLSTEPFFAGVGKNLGPIESRHFQIDQQQVGIVTNRGQAFDRVIE